MEIVRYSELSVDANVTLVLKTAEFNVTEPDDGNNVTVTLCFSAEVNEPLDRSAVFGLSNITDTNTSMPRNIATLNSDYDFKPRSVVIPTNFLGLFQECVNFTVFGDDMVEANEVIALDVQPVNYLDRFTYPPGSDSIRINIEDNDGKLLTLFNVCCELSMHVQFPCMNL
jgi:hypothetical protein